jgi:predicted GIY-YIG superfamily endonuclease
MAWVYVLQGSSGRLYVGATENLQQRLNQHQAGLVHTTRRMGTLTLVGTKEFPTMSEALDFERFLKAKKNPARVKWHIT